MLHLLVLSLSLASAVQSVLPVPSSSSAAPRLGLVVLLPGPFCAPSHGKVNSNFTFRKKKPQEEATETVFHHLLIESYLGFMMGVRTVFVLGKD